MRYAVITPARDEVSNLPRLASCLASQSVPPETWVIVDNGSSDGTLELARELSEQHDWVAVLSVPGSTSADRGAPVVRALEAGIAVLNENPPDIAVNVDADISFGADYFESLLARFSADPLLGIASGSGFEFDRGEWRQRHVTGSTVWGASRAYRWECLRQLLPFERRMAWDGIDEFKANARGWHTVAFRNLPFRHHRPEGHRDGSARRARNNQGRAAHYLGYRPWYLVLRAFWQARREPSALAMIWGYLQAAVAREGRCSDETARAYLRSQQSIRLLPVRAAEAIGIRRRAA